MRELIERTANGLLRPLRRRIVHGVGERFDFTHDRIREVAYQEVLAPRRTLLHGQVAAMNLDNFVVRPKRRLVERFAKPHAWTVLNKESLAELAHEVSGLPSEQEAEDEEAKRFDLCC